MNFTKNQIIIIGGALLIIFILVLAVAIPALKDTSTDKSKITAKLTVWGISNSPRDLDSIIAGFNSIFPKVTVQYRNFQNFQNYQKTLLDALAAASGPDIFVIRNTDLPNMINKIVPAPQERFTINQLINAFPQVVRQDFAQQNSTYALPLSIDTIALFYNKNLLDQAAVPIPTTWEEFINIIPRLTSFDGSRKITRSGAAIGSSEKSVTEASSILELLMLQNGISMISPDFTSARFASSIDGANALKFYTQFSDTREKTYTWNDSFLNDIDAFAQEKTAMLFGYTSAIPNIKQRNTFLNFAIVPTPQLQNAPVVNKIAYPKYYGFAVSKQSKKQPIAWEFILQLAESSSTVKQYLTATREPPALRSLAIEQQNDLELGAFARQTLIARSWPQVDTDTISALFSKAIEEVNINAMTPRDALQKTQEAVTALMTRK
ncbi:MAG: extracellular solute-binding protein [Patescibacteria group bacterium]